MAGNPFNRTPKQCAISSCAHTYCHVGGIEIALLNLSLLLAIMLAFVGAVITGLIMKAAIGPAERSKPYTTSKKMNWISNILRYRRRHGQRGLAPGEACI